MNTLINKTATSKAAMAALLAAIAAGALIATGCAADTTGGVEDSPTGNPSFIEDPVEVPTGDGQGVGVANPDYDGEQPEPSGVELDTVDTDSGAHTINDGDDGGITGDPVADDQENQEDRVTGDVDYIENPIVTETDDGSVIVTNPDNGGELPPAGSGVELEVVETENGAHTVGSDGSSGEAPSGEAEADDAP